MPAMLNAECAHHLQTCKLQLQVVIWRWSGRRNNALA